MKKDTERNQKKINKVRRQINKGRAINKDIIHIFVFFAVLFSALAIFVCYFLSFQASSVINNSYNRRSEVLNKTVIRGKILASDGSVLAYTDTENGVETRVYPYGSIFAHVVGFDTNGMLGLESSYNYYLLTSHLNLLEKISNEFQNKKNPGDDIRTTLNTGLQTYIYNLLGENSSAVVCMNPDTGEIYAMVSKPDFDPNSINDIWESIVGNEEEENSTVLLNRATQGLYTPGSTFKIFTLYEYYLENKERINNFNYNCTGILEAGETSISCYSGAHGLESLMQAFANSCNCAFGTIGLGLNLEKFNETTKKLLFDTDLPIDISSYKSRYSLTDQDDEYDIMATSIGQGNTLVSPIHLLMVVSAIANEGICMKPITVKEVLNPYGEVTTQFKNEVYTQLFTSEEAEFLKSYLRAVVTDGTANVVYPGNFVAYGKTGTAQKESDTLGEYDHSWFVGWAENNEQKLAVCVILENMADSGTSAAYISKLIFDYYFN